MTLTQEVKSPARPRYRDDARFYPVDGEQYPSVTTFLGIVDKSRPLMHWAANEERKAFQAAVLEVLTQPLPATPDEILEAVIKATTGAKASARVNQKALDIGTAAHAMIEWHTRSMMNEQAGPVPESLPEGAVIAYQAWRRWAEEVKFNPLWCERRVVSKKHGYAGTADTLALVNGRRTLCDYKTGKAVYPEAFLQNTAYRGALLEEPDYRAVAAAGSVPEGLILRLPKTAEDPGFEAVPVPPTRMSDVLAALTLWRWKRRAEGLPVGWVPA